MYTNTHNANTHKHNAHKPTCQCLQRWVWSRPAAAACWSWAGSWPVSPQTPSHWSTAASCHITETWYTSRICQPSLLQSPQTPSHWSTAASCHITETWYTSRICQPSLLQHRVAEGVRSVRRPKRRRDGTAGQQGAVWMRIAKDRNKLRSLLNSPQIPSHWGTATACQKPQVCRLISISYRSQADLQAAVTSLLSKVWYNLRWIRPTLVLFQTHLRQGGEIWQNTYGLSQAETGNKLD